MKVEHQFEATAKCPVDGKPDVYTVTVRADRVIKVEDILAAAKSLVGKPIFQEDFTQELHRKLACEVETMGYHSGVRTKVTCGGST